MMLRRIRTPHPDTSAAREFVRENGESVNAYYRWSGQGETRIMVFSPRWISHREAKERSGRACSKSDWWTPSGAHDSLGGTCAHEYGHHVTASIFKIEHNDFDTGRGQRLIKAIGEQLHVSVNASTVSIWSELNRIVEHNKTAIKRMVSEYGSTNAAELLAEIWQEWSTLGDNARPHIRVLGRLMAVLAEEGAFE